MSQPQPTNPNSNANSTTRIDKLFALLDSPTATQALKSAATTQLAQLAKHGHPLPSLFRRLLPLLRSKTWATRVAAANALEAMAKEAAWDPHHASASRASLADPSAIDHAVHGHSQPWANAVEGLTAASLDFQSITRLPPLLAGKASVGRDADSPTNAASHAAQRAYLMGKLGGSAEATGAALDHLGDTTSDSPPVPPTSQPPKRGGPGRKPKPASSPTPPSPAPAAAPPSAKKPAYDDVAAIELALADPGLSAREKNALRRKLKVMKKNGTGSAGPPPNKRVRRMESVASLGGASDAEASDDVESLDAPGPLPVSPPAAAPAAPAVAATAPAGIKQEAPPEPVVIAYKGTKEDPESMLHEEDEEDELSAVGLEPWPLQSLCDILAHDLLDPVWEVRHGAAMGIRGVVKVQGAVAGMLSPLSDDQNAHLNLAYLAHLTTRLVHVLCRDRFSDFIGDTVTVPVRESAAQALGVIAKHLPSGLVAQVHDQLITLTAFTPAAAQPVKYERTSAVGGANTQHWSLQLAAYLGLKYLLAVRQDLLADTLPRTFPAILQGLAHADDDVRAVAAATLLPIATPSPAGASLVTLLMDDQLTHLLMVLSHCLAHCDDLSASTAAVMDLVAALVLSPRVADLLVPSDPARPAALPLPTLVPGMCHLVRHPSSSVRVAVVRTLRALVRMEVGRVPSQDRWWIRHEVVRFVYQNMLVEEASRDVVAESLALWQELVAYLAACGALVHIFEPLVKALLQLALTPMGTPLPVELLVGEVQGVDKAMVGQDLQVVAIDDILHGRLMAARALGYLWAWWPTATNPQGALTLVAELKEYLGTPWAGQRQLASLVVVAFAHERRQRAEAAAEQVDVDALVGTLAGIVEGGGAAAPGAYTELRAHLLRVYSECLHTARDHAISLPTLEQFTLAAAQALVAFHPGLQSTIEQYVALEALLDARARASAAAALVALDRVPAKVTPLVRSLTAVLKVEENVELQQVAAHAVGQLAKVCGRAGKASVVDKLVKNLSVMVCSDAEVTPVVSEWRSNTAAMQGVITLVKEAAAATPSAAAVAPIEDNAASTSTAAAAPTGAQTKKRKRPANAATQGSDVPAAVADPTVSAAAALAASTVAVNPNRITHRGAQLALHAIAHEFGPDLFSHVPKLWHLLALPATPPVALATPDQVEGVQVVVDALQLNASVCAAVDPTLHAHMLAQVHAMIQLLDSPLALVRYMAARGVAAMAGANASGTLHRIVDKVLPKLQSPDPSVATPHARKGAVECIHHVAQALGTALLPYVVFLVVPLMGAMSDFDDDVRRLASASFAHLIQLVPVEEGLPDPQDFPQELIEQRASERAFLGQLLGTQKPEKFEVPVTLKGVELRPYQHEGINWMMFLNRYQLHGILCDDMGLGKTLQTITVVSSHHHLQSTKRPSLVVCPSTLTGHWQHEINKYSPNLCPVVYAGPPQERRRLQAQMRNALPNTVIITSYEVVRNDYEALGAMGGGEGGKGGFEYCVLDEGHVIRNAKTKLTQAVKTLKARHRLLLSGTPIQNNVLELWSLFDFLMPGFLGTEQQFNARFAKKILASRDAKKSSAEQEAGMRALKDLHRQVLPFVLRRLKEDVLDDLPPKIIQDYYCDLSPLQAKFYKDVVEAANPSTKTHVFQALQAMRRICNHPVLHVGSLQQRASAPSSTTGDAAAAGPQYSPLDPMLHTLENAPKLAALKQLLEDCGIGTSMSSASASSLTSGRPRHDNGSASNSSNNNNVTSVVDSLANHRVLIFAQMKQMLDLIESDLFRAHMPGVSYLRLDGSTDPRARHGIVTKFNDDPSIDVLLLTTQAGGLGLNLTGADTVIFVDHDWNPMRDLQAMDRAHRLGQKRVVNVYRLIARGTLEEKIMGLQRFKLHIAGQVVNQQNAALDYMDTDQLLDLFNVAGASGNGAASAASKAGGTASGSAGGVAAAIVEGLDELAQREYDDEYNMDTFLGSI